MPASKGSLPRTDVEAIPKCLKNGSGGENRTPDLGIMRPSLYH
jgi:hypothetical protein